MNKLVFNQNMLGKGASCMQSFDPPLAASSPRNTEPPQPMLALSPCEGYVVLFRTQRVPSVLLPCVSCGTWPNPLLHTCPLQGVNWVFLMQHEAHDPAQVAEEGPAGHGVPMPTFETDLGIPSVEKSVVLSSVVLVDCAVSLATVIPDAESGCAQISSPGDRTDVTCLEEKFFRFSLQETLIRR